MAKVNLNGLDQIMKQLESKIGNRKMDKIIDKALIAGGEVIASELEKNFESFKDTGESIIEITVDPPRVLAGKKTVTIHWEGPEDRWKIIHLNEYGTIKNPNPRGKGAVDRSLKSGREKYLQVVQSEISRYL